MRHASRSNLAPISVALVSFVLGTASFTAAQTTRRFTLPDDGPFQVQRLQVPGQLGVSIRDVEEADVTRDKLPGQYGAYVTDVSSGSAAEKAGIQKGDVIVEFDGERVRSAAELERMVTETPVGRPVKAGIVRNGKRVDVTVTTQSLFSRSPRTFEFNVPMPRDRQFSIPSPNWQRPEIDPGIVPRAWRDMWGGRIGIGMQDLTPQLRDYFGIKQGVLISSVTGGSAAARAGLKAGDVIVTIDKRDMRSAQEVRETLRERQPGDSVRIEVVRDHKPLTITVTIPTSGTNVR